MSTPKRYRDTAFLAGLFLLSAVIALASVGFVLYRWLAPFPVLEILGLIIIIIAVVRDWRDSH